MSLSCPWYDRLNWIGLAGHSLLIASLLGIMCCYSCHISVRYLTETAQNRAVTQHFHYVFNGLQLFQQFTLFVESFSYLAWVTPWSSDCLLSSSPTPVFCFTFSPYSLSLFFFICSSSKFSISKQLPFEGKRIFELCIGCLERAKVDWLQPGGNWGFKNQAVNEKNHVLSLFRLSPSFELN